MKTVHTTSKAATRQRAFARGAIGAPALEKPGGPERTPRASSPDLAQGLVITCEPLLFGLEGVVHSSHPVAAVRALTHVVSDEAAIERRRGAEQRQAIAHEQVLPPRLPLELLLATIGAHPVGLDGLDGDRLQGSEHHRPSGARVQVAILHVDVLTCVGLQLRSQTIHQEHGIGVGLDHPIVRLPSDILEDHVPCLHENQRVRRSAVLGHAHLLARRDHLRLDPTDERQLLVAQHGELVAVEDPGVFLELGEDEVHLVALGSEHGEAEQRRRRPDLRCARPLALRRLVLGQECLHLLEARVRGQALVQLGVVANALAENPLNVLMARFARPRIMASARLRALDLRLPRQERLELLEARAGRHVRVPLGVLVDAVLHREQDILVALFPLHCGVACLVVVLVVAVLWPSLPLRLGLGLLRGHFRLRLRLHLRHGVACAERHAGLLHQPELHLQSLL
mmetsp:Transcript_5203/g.15364  ORF Transcript_5203/g.15364 Transcript_5203/m.15364 type:complete len:454 (+) Transcript_5203:61-1422(+)